MKNYLERAYFADGKPQDVKVKPLPCGFKLIYKNGAKWKFNIQKNIMIATDPVEGSTKIEGEAYDMFLSVIARQFGITEKAVIQRHHYNHFHKSINK